jgi:KaiC/GvpD/RAD55 family RecA-like ATPase
MDQSKMAALMAAMQSIMTSSDTVPFVAEQAGKREIPTGIIEVGTVPNKVKRQLPFVTGTVLDGLFSYGEDVAKGVPMGCTIVFAGPPGTGKTREALHSMVRVAVRGTKCAIVVSEESFSGPETGRDDLCSRLTKTAIAELGAQQADEASRNMVAIEAQYHLGCSWDDFVEKYRYAVEELGVRYVVIDSLNMVDPTKGHTANNLSALKTYNHAHGVTCLCIGQIRDTGDPSGGEALTHAADAMVVIERLTITSKEMAAQWGVAYRDVVQTIRALKSVTTEVVRCAQKCEMVGGRIVVIK